jgi:hypothetical protein
MFDGLDMLFGEAEHTSAGALTSVAHSKNRPNFFKGKTEVLGLPDEQQAFQVCFTIESVARYFPRRARQEALALIKPYGLN